MLSYEIENPSTLFVSGDRETYNESVVSVGGVWSSEKRGWLVPRRNQSALNKLIIALGEKRNKKFHREVSDDEVEHNSEDLIKFYKKFQKAPPKSARSSQASGSDTDDGVYSSDDDAYSSSSSSSGSSEDMDSEIKHLKDVVYDIGARIKNLESIHRRR